MPAKGADGKLSYTLGKHLIFRIYKTLKKLGIIMHACNLRILHVEHEILWVPKQPWVNGVFKANLNYITRLCLKIQEWDVSGWQSTWLPCIVEHLRLISSTAAKTIAKPKEPPLHGIWGASKKTAIVHLYSVFLSRRWWDKHISSDCHSIGYHLSLVFILEDMCRILLLRKSQKLGDLLIKTNILKVSK